MLGARQGVKRVTLKGGGAPPGGGGVLLRLQLRPPARFRESPLEGAPQRRAQFNGGGGEVFQSSGHHQGVCERRAS